MAQHSEGGNICREGRISFPFKFIVSSHQGPIRLDRYLICQGLNFSRSKIQRMIQGGKVQVNGRRPPPSYLVRPGDQVLIDAPERSLGRGRPVPEDIPLEVVFEDEHLLVVNKSAGMVVHPAAGNYNGTLVNALLHHSSRLSSAGDGQRPGILHRLDKDTSGLLLVAKTDQAHADLARQLEARRIVRRYRALAWGLMEEPVGSINAPIGRSAFDRQRMDVSAIRGRPAVTHYRVLEDLGIASYLELRLETGRTHQIRVHLKHIGHPVVGDQTYGGTGRPVIQRFARAQADLAERLLSLAKRQALHAAELGFTHPVSRKYMEFESPLPEDIQAMLGLLGTNSP